jgi:uncharacterized delta-60 repeat protein
LPTLDKDLPRNLRLNFRPNLRFLALIALACATPLQAQDGTGANWDTFGPDRAHGVFVNITREHLSNQRAQGIAVDRDQRVLVLNEWHESGDTNLDCAVTRHLRDARLLDMDYTGPDELEATRRIAMDMGGTDVDTCSSIATDSANRAVVGGGGDYGGGNASGFVVRLDGDGDYDTAISSDGRIALKNLAAFAGTSSRLNHVLVPPNNSNRILACGHVTRGSNRNMLVLRFTSSGALDTGFSGDGQAEIDFGVDGVRNDSCARLTVLPDGDIVLAGIVTDADGDDAYGFARLNANGSFDNGFGNAGRLIVDDGADLAATPALGDIAWDAGRDRLLVGCSLTFLGAPAGCIIALHGDGSLDTSFDGDGRMGFRFSDYGTPVGGIPPRRTGPTRVERILPRGDGSFYVVGTHYNNDLDVPISGESDVASLRLRANGSVATSGPTEYGTGGVVFHAFVNADQDDGDPVAQGRNVAEVLQDATWYQGNLLLLADRPRYPENVFDHDGDGDLDEPGPIAPVVAGIEAEHLFGSGFDFDGLDMPSGGVVPLVPVPAGYGRYCSVRDPANGDVYGVLPQGPADDPCQVFLDGNPNLVIERAGLYSLAGTNWVIGTCDANFITLRGGAGSQPLDTAFTDSGGQRNCIFTVTPEELPIFSRPYTGGHVADTQAFNHDPYNIPLDVGDFGQPPGVYDACYIDNAGRSRSIGNPNANPSTCRDDGSGVDEPASDILVNSSRFVLATAAGRVIMAVPRHVPMFAPPGMDPYQREVFVRHLVGSSRYAEIFTSYYAHMQDTAVRRGDLVSAGTVLGRVGTTGSSTGEHLHISVHRHRNLSWWRTFEFNFSGGRHDRDGSVSAFDAWGWRAPAGVDPWAWRFRDFPGSSTLRDNAGTFSSNLWLPGEEPPLP